MKQFVFLLIILFTVPIYSNASHLKGGEITWKCLSNGQYQFYMNLYRECGSNLAFDYVDQILEVYVSGIAITQITVKPDTAKFYALNNGEFMHTNTNGERIPCQSSTQADILQVLPFISNPVTLNGIPPPTGMKFTWEFCCRTMVHNLNTPTSKFFLQAIMYPFENSSVDSCYDNSAIFVDFPNLFVNAGSNYSFSNAAWDEDLDSLVFEFDNPMNDLNDPITWNQGFSTNSPFPNTIHHPQNIPVKLKSNSGHFSGKIHNSSGINVYTYSVRVDSYSKGIKISSIWRDLNIFTKSQPLLNSGMKNEVPTISFNTIITDTLQISAEVEDHIVIPIMVNDNDIEVKDTSDTPPVGLQRIRLTAKGLLFSNDFSDSSNCSLAGISPCATLNPPLMPLPNSNQYGLIDLGGVNTLFEWQPSCDLLEPWENQKFFNFVFGAVDDHFSNKPVDMNFSTLTIEVNRKTPEIIQNGNVLTVLDTGNSYQWFKNDTLIPNSDTSSILINETGMYSLNINGNIACNYQKGYYEVIGCTIINDTLSTCNSLTWRDGITYTQSTTAPTFILPNSNGCDTVVKLNLTILKSESVDKVTSCTAYSWIDGNTYTQSTNTPQFILTNSAGCDSIITLNLTIPEIDTSINRNQNILQANPLNATYQWLDCENAFAEIPGETGRNFSPIENGIYSCEITKDGCKDTTECFSFYFIGLEERFTEGINIYPNPSKGNFIVELSDEIKSDIELKMMDINGRGVQIEIVRSNKQLIIQASPTLVKGIYFLNMRSKEGQANFKLVKL